MKSLAVLFSYFPYTSQDILRAHAPVLFSASLRHLLPFQGAFSRFIQAQSVDCGTDDMGYRVLPVLDVSELRTQEPTWCLLDTPARAFLMSGYRNHGFQGLQSLTEQITLLCQGNLLLHGGPEAEELAHFLSFCAASCSATNGARAAASARWQAGGATLPASD